MTEEDRRRIMAELDRLDEADVEASVSEQRGAATFVDSVRKWKHAQAAFGDDLTYDEFIQMARDRVCKGKRGRPTVDPDDRAQEPLYRAARDYDRIKAMRPGIARGEALALAARRHDVDEAALGELVRRPLTRRHDRRARRQ